MIIPRSYTSFPFKRGNFEQKKAFFRSFFCDNFFLFQILKNYKYNFVDLVNVYRRRKLYLNPISFGI